MDTAYALVYGVDSPRTGSRVFHAIQWGVSRAPTLSGIHI
jgi:hypothetical protein